MNEYAARYFTKKMYVIGDEQKIGKNTGCLFIKNISVRTGCDACAI